MHSVFPEKPLLVFPSLANQIGLEEATMVSLLQEMSKSHTPVTSQHYAWYDLPAETIDAHIAFWDALDIQRITQSLRERRVILLKSAPYTQSYRLHFAFNPQALTWGPSRAVPTATQRQLTRSATTIAANWRPDQETITSLAQLNIPEHFAQEHVPEFVRYWRENGEAQRAWGSKFMQYVKRQWTFHSTRLAKNASAKPLPSTWQPSDALQTQMASEGIPTTFVQGVLHKFRLYHQSSGTTHTNWDMPFFSWVKEEWQKQDTPFIETKHSTPMTSNWAPDAHTLHYLSTRYGIDRTFIRESIPEFVHKWIEKKAIFSEWGRVFAEHVIEQWRFVQLGITRSQEQKPIHKQWRPSADCMDILTHQSGIHQAFIEQHLSEFILYWMNRAEAKHSWDNIFLRHIKQQWALSRGGTDHARQQATTQSTRTKDRSIAQQLTDTSWAS